MRSRLMLPIAALLAVACTDRNSPTEIRAPSTVRRAIAPGRSLDQNITDLLNLFPKGLSDAGSARWENVKRKYDAGTTKPSQMAVAKDMVFELADWVQKKSPDMDAPPNGESTTAAAARLTLYMALYVYDGPSATPPAFMPGADNAVGLVTPATAATVVTPAAQAGVDLASGSVDENTIIVITQNPDAYPTDCSGPLDTKLCQYPGFYEFNQFPHKRLLKPGRFAVCRVNHGVHHLPLADHTRFRLAHTKPADPADYTPAGTIRDQNGERIEILPPVTQTLTACGDGQSSGGSSFAFSEFGDIDPLSQPDNSVTSVVASSPTAHPGDHIKLSFQVKNVGTATALSVPVSVRLSTTPTITAASQLLGDVPIPSIVAGETSSLTETSVVIPATLAPGNYYIGVLVGDDPTFPDLNLANNGASVPLTIDPGFGSLGNLSVGEGSVCALNAANTPYCWGLNLNRQLAVSGPDVASPFAPATLPSFVRLAVGMAQFNCGIKADLSAVCWGRGTFGQLGGGTLGAAVNPPTAVLGGISWAAISVNRLSACGLSTSGVGYCWGSNQRGENGRASVPLGTTAASATTSPAPIDGGLTFKSVIAGWLHACGIATSGAAYCWGDNTRGQLGIGAAIPDTIAYRSPVPVAGGLKFIQLSLGATRTCGITVDHLAYCWGENLLGELGDGTTIRRGVPTLVEGGLHFSYIATANGFAVGTNVPLPSGIQASDGHTCALAESGVAYCWGWNGAGQLGDGTTSNHLLPSPVSGGQTFTELGSGGAASCGRRGNAIWCWGANVNGQLGNGTFTGAPTPVLVQSPFSAP